ncbi:yrdC domain-containing protein [Hibiscus syriacus]|uniref:Threonylcarbamoyl-AMP synthase n=1 Tax=Hibiscus syriacus TaxID=106335 RepID=A0A6A3CG59_HIBSY|nr:yrdC domain-containing protein [Hibiscus syriacus]
MNFSTKFGAKLPLLSTLAPLREVSKWRFLPFSHQKRRFRSGFSKRMALNAEKCDVGVENKLELVDGGVENKFELVHSATESYADEAIEALKSGKVIAVPTDTLYGFACDACSSEAVNRIYEIKGRKHTSPLAICVGDVSDIKHFAVIDHLPDGLLDSLLPGPVTVILGRGEYSILEKSLNPGLGSIGVRVPDSNFIRIIARGSRSALTLTSANLSGQPSSVSIKDFENLWEHCAHVYDGGVLPAGHAGSTVVDLTKSGRYKILRPGSAKEETIAILEKYSLVEEAGT